MEAKIAGTAWDPSCEQLVIEEWAKGKVYAFDPKSQKPLYSIDTPPPYVNSPVHIGHAATYSMMDFFARFRRMSGWNVLFPFGLDRNGLPIEAAAEKKFGVRPHDVSREKFVSLCKQVLESSSTATADTFRRLGISFNSWEVGPKVGDAYLTDSPEYRQLTQDTFIDLWKAGLVTQAKRVNNYCPGCRTTIADAEIEYLDKKTLFNFVAFKVKETGKEVLIATTRPELLAACAAVLYNPKDTRYQSLKGKHLITPLYQKEIPILPHPLAKVESGTGLVMMCSFGDYTDVRFFREQKLAPVICIGEDGKMNHNAGFLSGLKIAEAREKIIEELRKNSFLKDQKEILHRTPICERSKHDIEFIEMDEYYLEQLPLLDTLRTAAKKIAFYSEDKRELLLNWIDSLSMDWAVSRRRVYATEIPLWYCKQCGKPIVPPKGRYYQPWKEAPPKPCSCGSREAEPEMRVFDTWFDSSISPLYILHYPNSPFFKTHKICTLRPQGKEIARSWLYYTLLRCHQLTKRPIFRDVWVHNHVLDAKGKKMSKSLGNVIDPQEILAKFGSEVFRFWIATEGDISKGDIICSIDRIAGAGKTLTKLWNAARFISTFGEPKGKPTEVIDRWIVSEINALAISTKKAYESYDFHTPVVALRSFLWDLFTAHYLEMVKSRAYNEFGLFTKQEQSSALAALNYCLDTLLKLLAPVLPVVTYTLYNQLRKKDIHQESFPNPKSKKEKFPFTTEQLAGLNSAVWKAKREKGLSLKAAVKKAVVPKAFKPLEKDLKAAHNIGELEFGENISIEV